MLFLLFRLGEDLYALEAGKIGEVLPMMRIKSMPGAPAGLAGLINHRGTPLPIIDLALLTLGRPARHKLSTRIVLVRDEWPDGAPRWLGLILEQATETLRRDAKDFVSSGLDCPGVSCLGPVLPGERELIQWIDPRKLLTDTMRTMLFGDVAGSA